MVVKWFAQMGGKNFKEAVAIFRSDWDDTGRLVDEKFWTGSEWVPTQVVSYWFFNGDATLDEVTESWVKRRVGAKNI